MAAAKRLLESSVFQHFQSETVERLKAMDSDQAFFEQQLLSTTSSSLIHGIASFRMRHHLEHFERLSEDLLKWFPTHTVPLGLIGQLQEASAAARRDLARWTATPVAPPAAIEPAAVAKPLSSFRYAMIPTRILRREFEASVERQLRTEAEQAEEARRSLEAHRQEAEQAEAARRSREANWQAEQDVADIQRERDAENSAFIIECMDKIKEAGRRRSEIRSETARMSQNIYSGKLFYWW